MSQYIDCYWLSNSRSSAYCKSFLDAFLPEREESAVDYPMPLHADRPSVVYSDVDKLMSYLEDNPNGEYMLYWRNIENDSSYAHGMIFYTNDGCTIVGLSIEGRSLEDQAVTKKFLQVQKSLDADIGCVTVEEIAPLNSVEFREFCQKRYVPSSYANRKENMLLGRQLY